MQFRRLLRLLPVGVLLSLLQGCGGGATAGGGWDGSPEPARMRQATLQEKKQLEEPVSTEEKRNEYKQNLLSIGVTEPEADVVMKMTVLLDALNKYGTSDKDAKDVFHRQFRKDFPSYSEDQIKDLKKRWADPKQKISDAEVEMLNVVIDKVSSGLKSANYVASQYLVTQLGTINKAGIQGDAIHDGIIAKVRKSMKGEQRFNELNEDMPLVADASGNAVLLDGLQEEQWYFYGQGYAFRGHWEPTPSTRQDYKGQGVEFGLLKALQNGWAFGGMLGYQKMKMEIAQESKSDASIYRIGPFLSWSDDRWTVDSLLSYGWVTMDTSGKQWKGSPKGSEWAAHVQGTYSIPLDQWAMGLKLVPEAYIGYRAGNIEGHDMKSGDQTRSIASSKQTGLTTRLGTGLNYTFPDLTNPTDVGIKVGLEKTFMWQDEGKTNSTQWAKTPTPETHDTAVYYGLGFNRQFGSNLDKLIGLDYMGSAGKKSGSDALTLTYRQQF